MIEFLLDTSIGELVVMFFLGIVRTIIGILVVIWFLNAMTGYFSKMFGTWGKPDGTMSPFDPRRFWCKHPVSYYGAGTAGLWALWCERCGKKVLRK